MVAPVDWKSGNVNSQTNEDKCTSSVAVFERGNTFFYLDPDKAQQIGMISKVLYREAIAQLPIACVDVFLYNPLCRTYLLVLRKDPPAQGVWWLPGGRLYKGETFFSCSQRKCKEEVGLEVVAQKVLYSAATLFPDSMWETQTHTINTIVFAILKDQASPSVDATCEGYAWRSMDEPPEDPYVLKAYKKALKAIMKEDGI